MALALPSGKVTTSDVRKAQEDLQRTLTSLAYTAPQDLDRKIADYVFFPLSHVLKQHQNLPSQALESALQCVLLLLQTAWKSHIDPRLAVQLLILFTILADPDASKEQKLSRTEEFYNIVYWCFAEDFKCLRRTKDGRRELLATSNVPYLGKAAFEILHGATDGPSQNVQLSALTALRAFIDVVDDREALSISFLPGIVSAAQKILLPTTSSPRSYRILVECLIVLSTLLRRVLSDEVTKDLPEPTKDSKKPESRLDKSWLNATAAQIKMILATVMKLRSHSRSEVRQALLQFCLELVKACRASLSDSMPFLIETLLTLSDDDGSDRSKAVFVDMLRTDESLIEILENSLYNWIVSLPRIMQSPDDTKKQRLIARISSSYELLSELDVSLSRIDEVLAVHLRDSVTSTLLDSQEGAIQEPAAADMSDTEMALILSDRHSQTWDSILSHRGARKEALDDLTNFTEHLATYESSSSVIEQLVNEVPQSEGPLQVSSFWTSLQMVRSALKHNTDISNFVSLQSTAQEAVDNALETLYDFSLSIINTSASVSGASYDWRLQALALETIAIEAEQLGTDFRTELVEALFPVVQVLGSSNNFLRRHAMTCLNIIASACDYKDARDLIISNVDYLTNAVALQMNSFEISAQAPQVLLMMVKLTGPRLLPYLDDTVESMFGALEQYHGYTKLAEALFSVLLAIAQEGAKTEQLAITAVEDGSSRIKAREPQTIDALAERLMELKHKRRKEDREIADTPKGSFPTRPWKEAAPDANNEDLSTISETEQEEEEEASDPPPAADFSEANADPPVLKTHSILLKISELTEHYLTAASPAFRTSLLSLLRTTFPALAKHENSFLPLINNLWPVVISRLDDPEAYVVVNALELIACMCQYAGNFMRSRIMQLWEELKSIARRRAHLGTKRTLPSKTTRFKASKKDSQALVATESMSLSQTSANRAYVDAPTRMLRESVIKLLVVIVDYVEIDDDIFDDALDILAPFSDRSEVKETLERRNADAVWLALLRVSPSQSTTERLEVEHDAEAADNASGGSWFPVLS